MRLQNYKTAGHPIIYIDESGFSHDMPRRYGYSPKGQRCYGQHNWQARGRTNIMGALLEKALLTVCAFTSNINSDIFHAWITQDLLPKVPLNSVMVMDNASFHKRKDIQDAIKNAGFILEYLPVYSPDLNPIEKKWAHAKARRRKERCDVDHLFSFFN
ncbi:MULTISPECIES: IS630 family transposase [Candidatus Fukatsuia]|uniref:IS630 family transposase n=1 Tax=Candidatus Fukatsuia TaxID=1927833 RepID=UPI0019673AB6|nr:IS630 family transposase [Candidatus Fukatsuia symbiotica]